MQPLKLLKSKHAKYTPKCKTQSYIPYLTKSLFVHIFCLLEFNSLFIYQYSECNVRVFQVYTYKL